MTPKLKAKELLDKMTWITINGIEFCNEYDKQCALIAVDEILKLTPIDNKLRLTDYIYINFKYWQEVKQEIEKL